MTRYVENNASNSHDPSGLFTIGIGGGFDFQILILHAGAALDLDIGFNTEAQTLSDFLSVNVSVTPHGSFPHNIALGVNADAHGNVTNATYAGDLNGEAGNVGGYFGPLSAEVIMADAYEGLTVGGGPGLGAGLYIDRAQTYGLHGGNTTPPPAISPLEEMITPDPDPMRSGDGRQWLNPGP